MNQILRLTSSSLLTCTCYVFSPKYSDKTYVCARCSKYHRILKERSNYSTFIPVLYKRITKHRKNPLHRNMKETELLKVTKTQTTQTTMTIGKLNASHVTAFAEAPGMILQTSSHLKQKVKENVKKDLLSKPVVNSVGNDSEYVSKNHLLQKSNIQRISNDTGSTFDSFDSNSRYKLMNGRLSNLKSLDSAVKQNQVTVPNYVPLKKFSSVRLAKKISMEHEENVSCKDISKSSDLDKHSLSNANLKIEKLNQLLLAYVDVCLSSGLMDHAFGILKYGSARGIKDPEVYNVFLKAVSKRGDLEIVCMIMNLMKEYNIPFTCETYALYLCCLAQNINTCNVSLAEKMLLKLSKEGFNLNDLFTKTQIEMVEKERILSLIRVINPNFDITPSSVNLNSNCFMVANLYKGQNSLTSYVPFYTENEMEALVKEQLSAEEQIICPVKKVMGSENFSPEHKQLLSELQQSWRLNLHQTFNKYLEIHKMKSEGSKSITNIYPYLCCLPVETFVDLMLQEIDNLCDLSEYYSDPTYHLYHKLGENVWYRYTVGRLVSDKALTKKLEEHIQSFTSWYINPRGPARNSRHKWQMLVGDNPDMSVLDKGHIIWPYTIKVSIGQLLYDIIFKCAKIPPHKLIPGSKRTMPAFYLVPRYRSQKTVYEITVHSFLRQLYEKADTAYINISVNRLPMLCPPKPWSSCSSGGYYFLPTDIVRETVFNINKTNLNRTPDQNLYAIFDAVNNLQTVAWRINEKVLDVALEVFKKGGSKTLKVPTNPDKSPLPNLPALSDRSSKQAYKELKEEIQRRREEYSLWCEGLYKLSLANHYRKKVFWLPQNMDFRGRVYPVPPHVSHITGDLYRSLLVFAKKQRLGPKGLDWLKIHLINLTGTHKRNSVQERLNYANQILPDILESANNPLEGKMWWAKSDEPWQTLSACFEINEILKSGDPESYESGFPVHQDGSCNGLQHYAALGKDQFGADSVNLSPHDKPQDIYSVVANLVENARHRDEVNGINIAADLKGFISRKIVKRPVMTTVYGVTRYGAAEQISGVLKDMPEFPRDKIKAASVYLSESIFKTLDQMFSSAREIQSWFYSCSDLITSHFKDCVSWSSPLGLPVIQPYFRTGSNNTLKPNMIKQRNAFAPNFIHSLDSTHMMLTALYCEQAGLTFASVHDCFWTHPSTVDVMNKICREQFLQLHSQNILQDLSKYFISKYEISDDEVVFKKFSSVPQTGKFDVSKVLNSVYFFS